MTKLRSREIKKINWPAVGGALLLVWAATALGAAYCLDGTEVGDARFERYPWYRWRSGAGMTGYVRVAIKKNRAEGTGDG